MRHGGAASLARIKLKGWRRWAVLLLCLVPPVAGFFAPVSVMARYALARLDLFADPRLLQAAVNSVLVSTATAAGASATTPAASETDRTAARVHFTTMRPG